jgi:hypothetical protein
MKIELKMVEETNPLVSQAVSNHPEDISIHRSKNCMHQDLVVNAFRVAEKGNIHTHCYVLGMLHIGEKNACPSPTVPADYATASATNISRDDLNDMLSRVSVEKARYAWFSKKPFLYYSFPQCHQNQLFYLQ